MNARPCRVLHVITGLDVGGAEVVLVRVARGLSGREFEQGAASINGAGVLGEELARAGVSVLPMRGTGGLGTWRFLRACRAFRPDVIVGWMYHGMLVAAILCVLSRFRTPVIWSVRCAMDDRHLLPRTTRVLTKVLALVSRMARRILYNSDTGRLQHEAHGFSERTAVVVPNGVDTARFASDQRTRAEARRELGIPESAFVIGHVARLHPSKGHRYMLDALAAMRPTRETWVVMAGRGVEEGAFTDVRTIEASLRGGRVLLVGERSDVPRLLAAMDVFCLTSVSEGFPNVVIEAMACGVTCFVTPAGDAPAIIGDTGEAFPAGEPVRLGHALTLASACTPEALRERGAAARRRVQELYSLPTMVARYRRILLEVTSHA
jgi:glycosyltransferase involved in cell wall biosynthesis